MTTLRKALATTTWLAVAVVPSIASAEDRVPIAVMDLAPRGVDEAAAAALTTEVSNTLSGWSVFRVITREDVKRMLLLEQTRQLCTGTADAGCIAEIAGALGVEYLVYGELARIAETYSLSLVLLDITKAEATHRVNRKIADAGKLLEEASTATKLLLAPMLEHKRGFLVLRIEETGAKVTVDGRVVGISPLAGRLDLGMGAHEVRIDKDGFMPWAKTIEVAPAQANVEAVALVPSQAFIEKYESSAALTRAIAWSTAGGAAALFGTAAVFRVSGNARFGGLVDREYLAKNGLCAEGDAGGGRSAYCPTALGHENDVLGTVRSIERTDSVALALAAAGAVAGIVSVYLFVTGDAPGRYSAYVSQGPSATVGFGPGQADAAITF